MPLKRCAIEEKQADAPYKNGDTMNKLLIITTVCGLFISANLFASSQDIAQAFSKYDANSKLSLGYDDLDAFLKAHVLVVGPSTRERSDKPKSTVGTRLKVKINRNTFLEGNRFYFESLQKDTTLAILNDMQNSLEVLPDEVPLALLNKDEQLAYWLNLYNFTLLKELANAYPTKPLNRILDYGDEDSLLAKKLLTVAGIPLSLNDIHLTILKHQFDANPLVIYGLFQGNIGGPNIRNEAYNSDNVWKSLERNAINYINSNRGTNYERKGSIKASVFYEVNMPFFDNDQQKLLSHLTSYSIDELSDKIESASKVVFSIKDWSFADVFGNGRQFGGGNHTGAAALLNAVQSTQRSGENGAMMQVQSYMSEGLQAKAKINLRFSALEIKMLKELRQNYDVDTGRVTVEDIQDDEEKQ